MRRSTYVPLAFAVILIVPLSSLTGGEDGFKLLFNGKDFAGWQPKGKKDSLEGKTEAFKGRFKIDKGAIVIDYTMKGDAYIETAKEFGKDVTIKFDFKPGEGCNNDFFLRGSKFDITPKVKGVKDGEWNTLEIIVTGDKIEHKINGESARKGTTTPAKPKDEKNEKAAAKYKEDLARSKSSTFMIRAEFGIIEIKNLRVKE